MHGLDAETVKNDKYAEIIVVVISWFGHNFAEV
jgi:hypothetical protein